MILFRLTRSTHYCADPLRAAFMEGWVPSLLAPNTTLSLPHALRCARLCLARPAFCPAYALPSDQGEAAPAGGISCVLFSPPLLMANLRPDPLWTTYFVKAG